MARSRGGSCDLCICAAGLVALALFLVFLPFLLIFICVSSATHNHVLGVIASSDDAALVEAALARIAAEAATESSEDLCHGFGWRKFFEEEPARCAVLLRVPARFPSLAGAARRAAEAAGLSSEQVEAMAVSAAKGQPAPAIEVRVISGAAGTLSEEPQRAAVAISSSANEVNPNAIIINPNATAVPAPPQANANAISNAAVSV